MGGSEHKLSHGESGIMKGILFVISSVCASGRVWMSFALHDNLPRQSRGSQITKSILGKIHRKLKICRTFLWLIPD